MVDISSPLWTEDDNGNTAPSPNGVQEGYAPSTVAPIIRNTRGALKRFYDRINGIYVSTGGPNEYRLTYEVPLESYVKGERFGFFAHATNTGPSTFNISSVGARAIVRGDGQPVAADEIRAGTFVELIFNGTNFSVVGFALPRDVAIANNLSVTNAITSATVTTTSTVTAPTFSTSVLNTMASGAARGRVSYNGSSGRLDFQTYNAAGTARGSMYLSEAGTLDVSGAINNTGNIVTGGTITVTGAVNASGATLSTTGTSSLVINSNTSGDAIIFHRLDDVLRGYTSYSRAQQSLIFGLHNTTGAGVRAMSYRESDGQLNVNGYITTSGVVNAGGGAAVLGTDGNVSGSAWGTESNVKAYIDAKVGAITTLPVGTVIDVYGNGAATIPGYLKVVPGLEITASYPQLRAFGLANGWARNAAGNPVMPNGDALFKRGWRAGQTRDVGRAFNTIQEDALQNITGSYWNITLDSAASIATAEGALYVDYSRTKAGQVSYASGRTISPIAFDASRVARTSTETRPANFTVTYYIKAYETPVDTGTVDVAKLADDINAVAAQVAAVETSIANSSWIDLPDVSPTSGAFFDWDNIPSNAREIEIDFLNFTGTAATALALQIKNGATLIAAGYQSGSGFASWGSGAANTTTAFYLPTSSNGYGSVVLRRVGPGWIYTSLVNRGAGAPTAGVGVGGIPTATLTGLRMALGSGTYTGGTFTLRYRM